MHQSLQPKKPEKGMIPLEKK